MLQFHPSKRGKLDLLTHTTLQAHPFGATKRTGRRNTNRSVLQEAPDALPGFSDTSDGEAPGTNEDGEKGPDFGDIYSEPLQIELDTVRVRPEGCPEQSAAGSADQLSDRWDSIREDLTSCYIRQLEQNNEILKNRMLSVQRNVQNAIALAASECPACCSDAHLTLSKEISVLWVGSNFRFQVSVPVTLCHACCKNFAVNPLQAYCFPSTPVHSWDLRAAPFGSRPVWFDLGLLKVGCIVSKVDQTACVIWIACKHVGVPLLQEVDSQIYVIKRLSMDRLSASLLRIHEANGCTEGLSYDVFRKQLSQAVAQLGYVQQRCSHMADLGAEDYPSGLLSECGGCWFAGQSGEVWLLIFPWVGKFKIVLQRQCWTIYYCHAGVWETLPGVPATQRQS